MNTCNDAFSFCPYGFNLFCRETTICLCPFQVLFIFPDPFGQVWSHIDVQFLVHKVKTYGCSAHWLLQIDIPTYELSILRLPHYVHCVGLARMEEEECIARQPHYIG